MGTNKPSREAYIQSINKMIEDIDLATIERIYHFIQRKWQKKIKQEPASSANDTSH